jgi:hypothetical protein
MRSSGRGSRGAAWVALALALAAPLAACDSKAAEKPAQKAVIRLPFNASDFGNPATGANPYLPIKLGTQSVRTGTTLVGGRAVPHQVTTTITDVYRTIDGVKTVVMLDHEIDGGQVTQLSLDYVAEDRQGNVWMLGGYTAEYEGGRFVSATDAWLQGVNGAKAGIVVQAYPQLSTPVYSVAQPDAEEGDGVRRDRPGRHAARYRRLRDLQASADRRQLGTGADPDRA